MEGARRISLIAQPAYLPLLVRTPRYADAAAWREMSASS
jgi:hypothetical protein